MAPIRGIRSPNGWVDLHTHKRDILSDFVRRLIDIPEADPRPYATLDAALLLDNAYVQASRRAPVYKTDKPIVFAESMCVVQLLDGTESLVLYFQNYTTCLLKSVCITTYLHTPVTRENVFE